MGLAIFLALVATPMVEIAVFVKVGGWLGLWPTLALVIGTAIAGGAVLHHQGLSTLESARRTVERGEVPLREIVDGVGLLLAGALLLTPGFVTDIAGAILLVPPLRRALALWIAGRLAGRAEVRTYGFRTTRDDVIDGEFTVVDDEPSPPGPQARTPGRIPGRDPDDEFGP